MKETLFKCLYWIFLTSTLVLLYFMTPMRLNPEKGPCSIYDMGAPRQSCQVLQGARVKKNEMALWVHKDHLDNFCQVATQEDVLISVRKTGKYSIKKIGKGAPTKGHDILDKTLKPKSLSPLKKIENLDLEEQNIYFPDSWLNNENKITGKTLASKIESFDLQGYVGWWIETNSKQKIPVGVYTVYSGCASLSNKQNLKPEGGCRLSFKELIQKTKTPLDIMTGDYDLHDIIAIHRKHSRRRIPSAFSSQICLKGEEHHCSLQEGEDHANQKFHNYGNFSDNCESYAHELRVSCALNNSIQDKRDCTVQEKSPGHCGLIRHGAQSNYLEYQQITSERLIPALVNIDPEIAIIEPASKSSLECHYYLLGNNPNVSILDEYQALYQISNDHNCHDKETHHPSNLALENARGKKTPELLLQMERDSIKLNLENKSHQISLTLNSIKKKEKLNLETDCLETLYEAEQFQKLINDGIALGVQDKEHQKTLFKSKNFLCQKVQVENQSQNEGCLQQIKKESQDLEKAQNSWKAMTRELCDS